MTPRLSRLVDAVLPRVGLALAVYRIGLLTVELDATRKTLEIERAERDWVNRRWRRLAQEHYDGRIEAEARLVRWRDALGDAVEQGTGPTGAAVRNILDDRI